MLNRKQLPNFGVLTNIKVDIQKIVDALRVNNLLNFEVYNDIDVSKNGKYSNFTVTNSFNKRTFFTVDESLVGEEYRQLYLTDPEDSIANLEVEEKKSSVLSRTRRLDPSSKDYDPIADELNYGKLNDRCIPEIKEILDQFSQFDKVTRVRLALLKSHFSIKPHVDYDPSYIVRYHIPLITNPECKLSCKVKGVDYSTHFKPDGSIYFLNAGHLHWASNDSDSDRLHLIIDVHGQNLIENIVEYV